MIQRWSGIGGGFEIGFQEGQGALAGQGGGVGFVIGTVVAVEAVAGFFVKVDGKIGVSLLDFLDFGGGDVSIFGAEMHDDGTTRFFGCEFGDLPTVIADGRSGVVARRRKPGKRATETETNNADFLNVREPCGVGECRGDIEQSLFHANLFDDLHATSDVGGVVVELNAGLHAIEEAGSQGDEALGGVVVDDGTNVAVDAEDFLNDDDGRSGGGGGLGEIGVKPMAVGGGEFCVGTHGRERSLQRTKR
jgi:hypothetical protein